MPTAFRTLETLPRVVSFEIVQRVDQLASFPLLGKGLRRPNDVYRQLVVRGQFRVVYRYDEPEQTVSVLILQKTYQPRPTLTELREIEREDDDSEL
jgi:mRNA-degrading endonuclease RelE of RelBE toxin-antitoxin system